ncbi:MAG: serine hydrolase domain-containing protein [Ilumatobacteraceae bacterium]
MSRCRGRIWGVLAPLTVAALAVSACASARDSSENASAPSVAAPVVATTGATAALPEPDASSTTVPASSSAPPSGPSTGPSTTTTRPKPTTTTTTTPPLQEIDWDVFDISLTDQIVNGRSRAASVAVALDGRIVHRGAYGQRVPGEALAPSDRFRVASISKPILSATVLRLVDEGELCARQARCSRWWPSTSVCRLTDPRAARVTVRQLLAHTSGFGEFENELFYAGSMSCPHAASIAFAEALDAGPGKDYLYSNMNFCLLGLVVEAAQDTPFQRVVQREVLRPVGVTDMRTAGTRDVRANDVLHDVAPGRTFMETLGAAGTWIATPSDIVKFGDSLDPAKPGAHPVRDGRWRRCASRRRRGRPARRGATSGTASD